MFDTAHACLPLNRRSVLLGASALLGTALASPALGKGDVNSFVAGLWEDARSRNVPRKIFDAALGKFRPVDSVVSLSRKQPEFVSTTADYIGKRITDRQASIGRGKSQEWAQTLAAVEERYGVQAEIVLSVWGNETSYGSYMGGTKTPNALATLAWSGYREQYFRNELLTALEILAAGHVAPADMVGSWAGAMGHPQFMPTSFMAYAVDFRGDGHKDVWGSIPDALASTANYLKENGWRAGETWGYEVKLPKGFDYGQVWSRSTIPLSNWAAQGVGRSNGKAFPRGSDTARVYMPMGGTGPVFLVLANFDVIKRYNNSDSYGLAVGHLADRILGSGSFVSAWPDDTALNKASRVELQQLLTRKGYQVGTPDGVIGSKTRAAVIDWQSRAGLLPDGHVGGKLLARIKG